MASVLLNLAPVLAGPLRIVTYNIEADTGGYTSPRPGLDTVLQGIGNENVNGITRPVDILGLEETTSNTQTVDPVVNILNNLYGAGTYARSPYQATDNCSSCTGNGPNAMVYNQTAVQLIDSFGIGTPSSSGAPRQPVRYQFRPVGGSAANDFYVYVSHMKSGTTQSDIDRRNVEAQMFRSNANLLPDDARIIYTGDFNWGGSTEAAYVTLAASTAQIPGQAFDPINRPGNWQNNSTFKDILTESATNLRYRDDCHLVTQNVLSDASGIQYITGSYHTFGVNGTTPVGGNVNSPSNTALPGLPNRSAVLQALTTASDHLPMVADYNLVVNQQVPTISVQPVNDVVCSGDAAGFSVTASGTPSPGYQWRQGTTNLANGGQFSGTTTPTLTISPASAGDAANNYNCVVSNSAGSATSDNAALIVNSAPSLGDQPMNQAVCLNQATSFSITASGSPSPSYQWYRGAGPLQNGGNISGSTTATLNISAVAANDAASDYHCVVTNPCGTSMSNDAALTIYLSGTGDGNGDSLVDANDIQSLIDSLLSGGPASPAYCAFDLDYDGVVDLADVDIFVDNLLNS